MAAEAVPRLVIVDVGDAARLALDEAVTMAKGGDPLAPVTVLAPTALAALTLRRRLARDRSGLLNVAFTTLPQVADRLAAPVLAANGHPVLPHLVEAEAVRAVLADRPPGDPLAAAVGNVAAEQALARTLAELDDLDEPRREQLAAGGRRAAAVVDCHRRFRAATAAWAGRREVLEAAAAAVARGDADGFGPVVLHLPRRLRPGDLALLGGLAERGRLLAIVGRTGDEPTDASTSDVLVAQLATLLGPAASVPGRPRRRPVAPVASVVRAPDPAEEVRVVVRMIVDRLRHGVVPERMAVAFRTRDPYALLLHEELTAAGVPHHGPGVQSLSQTATGRALLGLVGLAPDGFRRADVMRWLRAAPIVDPATGRRAPAARWSRRAREAGVAGGAEQWRQRLARAIASRRSWAVVDDPDAEPDRGLAELESLAGFVDGLLVDADPGDRRGWTALTTWAESLLDGYLDPTVADDGPAGDGEAVRDVLRRLRALDSDGVAGAPVDPERFRRVVEHELERVRTPVGRFGHGVALARVADLVGADADVVFLVGLGEGTYPPRPSDDPLVPDAERAVVGLGPRRVTRAEEHRDHVAAMAAAPEVVVSFARADPRAQRERQPARWLLDACSARAGATVHSTDLDVLRDDPSAASWFVDVESFEWWLAEGCPAASPHDFDVGQVAAARRLGRQLHDVALAQDDPVLARGFAAADARRRAEVGIWTGFVGARPELVADLAHPRSATALEAWRACPFRYFLSRVLSVAELDDPAEAAEISPADQGSLVHAVLERFLREHRDRPPDAAWSDTERAQLVQMADEVADDFVAEGRTGRPLLWRLQWARLRRHLDRILDDDAALRRDGSVTPVDVELGFGFDDGGHPAVAVAIGGGRQVLFRGRIDRIDRSTDGRRLVVLDYKTGSANRFTWLRDESPGRDLTRGGRHLQLHVYAQAARTIYGDDVEVEARYWFVGPHGRLERLGGVIDRESEARFHAVLTTIVDGIEAGRFPANPGDDAWVDGRTTHEHCRFCPYDRACPTSRAEQWVVLRDAPELAAYVALDVGDDADAAAVAEATAP
jgi:hypothetical protein